MLKLTRFAPPDAKSDDILALPFESRQKSRLKAVTERGRPVALLLQRGHILRSGTILTGDDGIGVEIRSAPERVSVLRTEDPLQLARACYHLGNRHVPLQIGKGELRYQSDHVLDHMLESMGFRVSREALPFEPEAGAYHGHGHEH